MLDLKRKYSFSGVDGTVDTPVTIPVTININNFTRLMVLPDSLIGGNNRHEVSHPKIDFTTETTKFKLDGQTYIGTVRSLCSDAILDIYLINHTGTKNGVDYTETFFIAFPSLALLPDSDSGALPDRYIVDGVVFGITDDYSDTSSSYNEIGDRKVLNTYLPEDLPIQTPDILKVSTLSLIGLSEDSMFNAIETVTSVGQINSDKALPSQVILLGDYTDLFADYIAAQELITAPTGLPFNVSHIENRTFTKFTYGKQMKRTITKGMLAIPLNF